MSDTPNVDANYKAIVASVYAKAGLVVPDSDHFSNAGADHQNLAAMVQIRLNPRTVTVHAPNATVRTIPGTVQTVRVADAIHLIALGTATLV